MEIPGEDNEKQIFPISVCNKETIYEISKINRAIAETLFQDVNENLPVYLDFEPQVETEILELLGNPDEEFTELIQRNIKNLSRRSDPLDSIKFFAKASKNWLSFGNHLEEPPALILLAALSLAAESMQSTGEVSSNNFYRPLAEQIGYSGNTGKLGIAYRGEAITLWETLDVWLNAWEGIRGISTIHLRTYRDKIDEETGESKINSTWAVRLATSQSRLRDADRQNLQRMFGAFRLHALSNLSDEVMFQEIDRWCAIGYASKSLQKLWSDESFEDDLVQAAQEELKLWPGPSSDEQSDFSSVRLVVAFDSINSEISIGAEILVNPKEDISILHLGSPDGQEIEMQGLGGGRFRISDPTLFDPVSLISEGLKLFSTDGQKYERKPKHVVVLKKTTSNLYIEVPQATLAENHSALFINEVSGPLGLNFSEEIPKLLTEHAHPMWKILSSSDVEGLPSHWSFVLNIQMLCLVGTGYPHLSLSPLKPPNRSTMSFEGGVLVPGSQKAWLSANVPTLSYSVVHGNPKEIVISDGKRNIIHSESIESYAGELDLNEISISTGDYRVEVLGHDGKRLLGKSLSIVSGDLENRRWRSLDSHWGYRDDLRLGLNPVNAISHPVGETEPQLNGLSLDLLIKESLPDQDPLPKVPSVRGWSEINVSNTKSKIRLEPNPPKSCMNGEGHRFIFPTWYGERAGIKDTIEGTCVGCGIHKILPASHSGAVKDKKIQGKLKVKTPEPEKEVLVDLKNLKSIGAPISQVWDFAFETLCYLRQGKYRDIANVAAQCSADGLALHNFILGLVTLGHLDVGYNTEMQVDGWTVAPPQLVMKSSTKGFLSGFRSRNFLTNFSLAVDKIGGSVEENHHEGLPSAISVNIPTSEALSDLVELLEGDYFSLKFGISQDASMKIIERLPHIEDLKPQIPQSRIPPYKTVQIWDSEVARWQDLERPGPAGAYRFTGYGSSYRYTDVPIESSSYLYVGSASLVKHFESIRVGNPLFYYDEESRIFTTRLGAELPELYGRAAVASSGYPPIENHNLQALHYSEISMELARLISKRFTRRENS